MEEGAIARTFHLPRTPRLKRCRKNSTAGLLASGSLCVVGLPGAFTSGFELATHSPDTVAGAAPAFRYCTCYRIPYYPGLRKEEREP